MLAMLNINRETAMFANKAGQNNAPAKVGFVGVS
jgi:hypothetical protein